MSSPDEGRVLIERVRLLLGNMAPDVLRRHAPIDTAAAYFERGDYFIVYSPDVFERLRRSTGSDCAIHCVFAHEIAHHAKGHTKGGSSKPMLEEEADWSMGFLMYRYRNADRQPKWSITEIVDAVSAIVSESATATHPARKDRIDAIRRGWQSAVVEEGISRLPPALDALTLLRERQQLPRDIERLIRTTRKIVEALRAEPPRDARGLVSRYQDEHVAVEKRAAFIAQFAAATSESLERVQSTVDSLDLELSLLLEAPRNATSFDAVEMQLKALQSLVEELRRVNTRK